MDEELKRHLGTLGVSLEPSRVETEYADAPDLDHVNYAAGEALALHAAAISMALPLPSYSGLRLAAMKRLDRQKWQRFWDLHNQVFCAAAFIDLCEVRSVFQKEGRWTEYESTVMEIFPMAHPIHFRTHLRLSDEERESLKDGALKHMREFWEVGRNADQQLERLMTIEGIQKERVNMPALIESAIKERSWLDPWALIRHYDRLSAKR